MILVDTSIWVPALRKRASSERRELATLLESDDVATTDVVVAEVLQGASDDQDLRSVVERLDALHFFHADASIWLRAGELSYRLKRKGMITPLADIVIALVALDNDLEVFAKDDHFDRIEGLKLHRVRT